MTTTAARRLAVAFGSGLLFAIGLGVSGMTRPSKVIGFLDMFGGHWDPSLMFVMGGAIAVHLPFYRWLRRRPGFTPPASTCAPAEDAAQEAPADENDAASVSSSPALLRLADRRLLLGAAVFGLGWGLGGYCPGPAVASVVSATPGVLVFVGAMLVGMMGFGRVGARRA